MKCISEACGTECSLKDVEVVRLEHHIVVRCSANGSAHCFEKGSKEAKAILEEYESEAVKLKDQATKKPPVDAPKVEAEATKAEAGEAEEKPRKKRG